MTRMIDLLKQAWETYSYWRWARSPDRIVMDEDGIILNR